MLRQRWANTSIHYKAIVLCIAFVVPILIAVGILIVDFNAYRQETNAILSEYSDCLEYSHALQAETEQLNALLLSSNREAVEKYDTACKQTADAWRALSAEQYWDSASLRLNKQVIDRAMEDLHTHQQAFLRALADDRFQAAQFTQLQERSSYLAAYTDELIGEMLLQGRDRYLTLGRQFAGQNVFLFIIAALCCVLFAWVVLILVHSLILPVRQISSAACRVAGGDYHIADITLAASDEIGILAASFNHMKNQILQTIFALEKEAALEKSLRQQERESARLRQLVEESRFAHLQSQINPHFLFNTLQSVSNMADIEHATVTEDMILRLANFFRYTLESDGSMVTVDRELSLLRDYISLQELRFGERIAFEMNCDSRCAEWIIPKFMLQPIVENSIVHGMRDRSAGGRIRITTRYSEQGCCIQITDNGVGFDDRKILSAQKEGRKSIGLSNIASRIELVGGSFRLCSVPGLGTTARLTLPMPKEEP